MDDVGVGEFFAKGFLSVINLFLMLAALFLMYFRDKRAYILLSSVLLNIASGRFFGDIHEVMTWDNTFNYVLWKIANVILLIWIVVKHFTHKEKKLKKSKTNKLRSGMIIFFICLLSLWLALIIFFISRAILLMLGHL